MDTVIGADIGGTLVRIGLFNTHGKLLDLREAPIEAERGPQAGLERIAAIIDELIISESESRSLLGIGIGCTGPVDPLTGFVNNPYTLPTWENVPLGLWLEQRFGVPVRLENDADAAALGEYWQGAGNGVSRLYAVTVGTGIGTALIVDGQIYRGLDGSHPEGGHHIIDTNGPLCYCGSNGCWESLASGTAIARIAREAIEHARSLKSAADNEIISDEISQTQKSPLFDATEDQLNSHNIANLAQKGDALAESVIQKSAYYLSLGILNIVLLFTPEVIVLSGGVMKSAELFMPTIKKMLKQHPLMVPADKVQILRAKLGPNAGMYGAAFNIIQRY